MPPSGKPRGRPPGSSTQPNAMAAIATEILASDPELQAEAREFVRELMRSARRLMIVGNADVKLRLYQSVVPHMLKAVGTAEADEAERQREDARRRMMAALAGKDEPAAPAPQSAAPKAVRRRS